MSIDLTSLAAPAVPSKGSSSGFFTVLILAVVGFLAYKLFFSSNNTNTKEK